MHSGMLYALRISTAIMVLCGYLALFFTPVYGGIVLIIPLCLLVLTPLGALLDSRFALYRRCCNNLVCSCVAEYDGVFAVAGLVDSNIFEYLLISPNAYGFPPLPR